MKLSNHYHYKKIKIINMIKNKLGAKIITKFAFPRQKIIHTRKIMVVK